MTYDCFLICIKFSYTSWYWWDECNVIAVQQTHFIILLQISWTWSFYEACFQQILGFLNLFLFASNIWFLYKETSFFQALKQQQQQQQQQFMPPPQGGDIPPQQLPQQY